MQSGRAGPDPDDDRQPAHDRGRPAEHSAAMPQRAGEPHRDHARDGYDGGNRRRAGAGAGGQDRDSDRGHDSLRVRQLRRTVQSRKRLGIRADAAGGRLRRDERPVFRLGPRA